jgi:hypothetical protein
MTTPPVQPSIALVGPELKLVHDAVQETVMQEILDTYGTYLSFSDPILLQSDLERLSAFALENLPPSSTGGSHI